MTTIASVYWQQEQFEDAMRMQEERIRVARSCGDQLGEGVALANNFLMKLSRGDRKGAIADARVALPILNGYGDPRAIQLQTWLNALSPD